MALNSVKFVRIGQSSATFRAAQNVKQFENRSFSLVYGDDFETLDLIAKKKDFEVWIMGLSSLVSGAMAR